MTDFLDCLKHKYAYVAIGEFKPGCFSEARQLYEKAVSTYSDGFDGAYLLQEPGSDRGISIIFRDNPGDMEEHHTQIYDEALSKISHLFVEPPKTGFYEVCSEIMPMLANAVGSAQGN